MTEIEKNIEKRSQEIFSKRLRELRDIKDVSREQIAVWAKCSVNTVYRWESGKQFVTAETLDLLCNIFNVSPVAFFSNDPPQAQTNHTNPLINDIAALLQGKDDKFLLTVKEVIQVVGHVEEVRKRA